MAHAEQVGFVTGGHKLLVRNGPLTSQRSPLTVHRHVSAAVLPSEGRRAAEIQRLTAELERLRAQKNAVVDRKGRGDARHAVDSSTSHESRAIEDLGGDRLKTNDAESLSVLSLLGKHSQGSRFCSVSMVDGKEYYSRIIAVAGRVPGVHANSVREAPRLGGDGFDGESERGTIAWTKAPVDYSGEIVPLSSTEVLASAIDPVGLRVAPAHVGLAVKTTRDALVVVERDPSQLEFDNVKIYAWDIGGEVHVGWFKDEPSRKQARCLGRVLCVFVEEDKDVKAEKSCWLETDEVF